MCRYLLPLAVALCPLVAPALVHADPVEASVITVSPGGVTNNFTIFNSLSVRKEGAKAVVVV